MSRGYQTAPLKMRASDLIFIRVGLAQPWVWVDPPKVRASVYVMIRGVFIAPACSDDSISSRQRARDNSRSSRGWRCARNNLPLARGTPGL
jgi:hypothetical protein